MNPNYPELRQDAVDIFQAGLKVVEPGRAIRALCRLDGDCLNIDGRDYDLTRYRKIVVIGAGKAGAPMAKALEELLGNRIAAGLICVKYGHVETLKLIETVEAGHPVPDDNGVAAARRILDMAAAADETTLILCILSGGGSALLPLPVAGVSLGAKQETTKILLACGATIHEINAIRKHLSAIKGGNLARAAAPATLVSLILSDVVGDDLDSIASGPCVPDSRTYDDCLAILDKYDIEGQVPAAVLKHLRAGRDGAVSETPKAGEPLFEATQNVIVASNFDALLAAKEKADGLGYETVLLSSMLEGETRDVAANHVAIAREMRNHGFPAQPPACLLSGGETTVRIRGAGLGGRNQEFVLAAAVRMAGLDDMVVLSAGTDGNDGPTDAAGALADGRTVERARALGLDARAYLDDNDSYNFFDSLDLLYKTGPTNTNVMDIRIILVR